MFPNKAQREQIGLPSDAAKELLSGDQSRDSRHFDFRYSTDKQLLPEDMK